MLSKIAQSATETLPHGTDDPKYLSTLLPNFLRVGCLDDYILDVVQQFHSRFALCVGLN